MNAILDRFSRLNSKLTFIILVIAGLLLAAIMAFVSTLWGISGGIFLILAVVAPLSVYCILRYPVFGVIFYLITAYFIMFISGFGVNFPLGTLMDGTLALLVLGFFFSQKYRQDWGIFKDSITAMMLVWIAYNVMQIANPTAESRLAWVYTIRAVAAVMVSYFIFNFQIRTISFIRLIIKVWLVLSIIAAIYALKQEYLGFFAFEQAKLDADPMLQNLLFIDGHWRKNSIFSDPVAFSYNMVVSSILCISLIAGPTSIRSKIILGSLAGFFMYVALFSGTRGSYVLLPSALVLFAILKFNKQVFIFSCIFALFFLTLINIPTSNTNILRFQTAFRPNDDPSFNVRKNNLKRIQPYILSHPMGGGLGATGVWGVRFAPNSFLAQFPPDSGFVRVAVELGWLGLMIQCTLIFVVLKTGINKYFQIKNPELQTYCLAMVLIIFALTVGNFPQEAFVQFPLSVYFYLFIAIMNITHRLDQEEQQNIELANTNSPIINLTKT